MQRLMVATVLALGLTSAWGQISSGTGFSVAPQLLVTNHHVVEGCGAIEVIAPDGRWTASVIDTEASIDLALLRVFGLKGAAANLRNPRSVQLGEPVTVFGFPLSGALSTGGNFTSGIVSALQGLRNAAGEIQITAPIQRGNSGGPVMDASGVVIGVVVSKLDAGRSLKATGDIPQNVNFAISLDVLSDFLSKNKVPFRDSAGTAKLDTTRVAQIAQGFTYRVECRGKPRQAEQRGQGSFIITGLPPNLEPKPRQEEERGQARQPPVCQGPLVASTSTNCAGAYTWPNGVRYDGAWLDGKRHGQGTQTWPDGRKYVGEWRDDKVNGQGTLTKPSGEKYVGAWQDYKVNGQGTLTYSDGRHYIGVWRDDERHGPGTQTWPDGGKYVGEWRDDKINGRGIRTWPDGRRYEGAWANDRINGQGTLTWRDGQKHVGEFKDGKANGEGTRTRPDGTVIHSGMWRAGKPVR